MSSKLYLTYNTIHKNIAKSVDQIKIFNPDVLLVIGCGGFIPGRILRTYFPGIPVYSVIIKFYNEMNSHNVKPIKFQWLDREIIEKISNKRVLIVDEVDDTRQTLSYCTQELIKNGLNPYNLGIYVIHNKNKKKNGIIDKNIWYYATETIEDVWVEYPWEAENIVEHGIKVLST